MACWATPNSGEKRLSGCRAFFRRNGCWRISPGAGETAAAISSPGSTWEYGHSTDVLGRVVEVASGQTLDVFLAEKILRPLKMNDTGFHVPREKHNRIAQPIPDKYTGKTPGTAGPARTRHVLCRRAWLGVHRRATTCASPACCSTAVNWMGFASWARAPSQHEFQPHQ